MYITQGHFHFRHDEICIADQRGCRAVTGGTSITFGIEADSILGPSPSLYVSRMSYTTFVITVPAFGKPKQSRNGAFSISRFPEIQAGLRTVPGQHIVSLWVRRGAFCIHEIRFSVLLRDLFPHFAIQRRFSR